MANKRLKGKGKAPEAIPASIDRTPRCQEKKHNSQCTRNKDHKGPHTANAQDFVLIWSK